MKKIILSGLVGLLFSSSLFANADLEIKLVFKSLKKETIISYCVSDSNANRHGDFPILYTNLFAIFETSYNARHFFGDGITIKKEEEIAKNFYIATNYCCNKNSENFLYSEMKMCMIANSFPFEEVKKGLNPKLKNIIQNF
ncbi:MAG: hypothetical protein WC656_04935 [Sulfurimonas sp.]|jgi:hypothetical protein